MSTYSRRREKNDARIAEQAAEWLVVLERGNEDDNKAFAAWLTESRRHVEEFLFASALERVLDGVDAERRVDVEGVLARANGSVVRLGVDGPLPHPPPLQRRREKKGWIWGIAAGVAAVVISAWGVLQPLGWQSYRTALGEQRAIELTDGSVIHLNTQSRLQVRFTDKGRDLRLLEGEALFDVKRDPARPFRVDAGSTVVQAVGTRFNIYRRSEATTVSVIEGAVSVSGEKDIVAAGQEARVIPKERAVKRGTVDVERVSAWRQRRLMFRADTLADIAAEFNRYNRTPQIRVEDEDIRARRFTGIFNADDPESLAAFLAQQYPDLSVEQKPGGIIIRHRAM